MHELGIASALIEQVQERAQKLGATAVKSVTIKVGVYSGVCVESLEFAYGPLAEDTLLANSKLIVQTSPFVIYCPHCQQQFRPTQFRRTCEQCQARDVTILTGRELDLVSMEIITPSATVVSSLAGHHPSQTSFSQSSVHNQDKNYV